MQQSLGELPLQAQLAAIDWTRPWLAHVANVGAALAAEVGAEADNEAAVALLHRRLDAFAARIDLRNAPGLPVRFVPQQTLPEGMAYEAYIHETGCVPTRGNLHDFFNALVWLHFPRIKVALNRMQARQIAMAGVQATRGGARDAATLFDENAVLFVSDSPGMAEALQNFGWQALFIRHRAAWGPHCKVLAFGHALMEKLVTPYKAITAHAWKVMAMTADPLTQLDAQVARQFDGITLQSRQFSPLPVLGIPGWWPANEDPRFYDDAAVFRPGRLRGAVG